MKMTPWAKLTMRMMPKISVSPQAMKKRIDACESALRHCARMKPNQFIGLLVSQTRMGWCGDKDCRTGDWLDLPPLPVEVRIYPTSATLKVPNSGKPEFGWERERAEFAAI